MFLLCIYWSLVCCHQKYVSHFSSLKLPNASQVVAKQLFWIGSKERYRIYKVLPCNPSKDTYS